MNKKCYDTKNCIFKTKKKLPVNCPVYDLKITCFEYDWSDFYAHMPKCKERSNWKKQMLGNCQKCAYRKQNKEKVDEQLKKLKATS